MTDITWYGQLLQTGESHFSLYYWNAVKKAMCKKTYYGHALAVLTKLDNEYGWEIVGVTQYPGSRPAYHMKNSHIYDKEEWHE